MWGTVFQRAQWPVSPVDSAYSILAVLAKAITIGFEPKNALWNLMNVSYIG